MIAHPVKIIRPDEIHWPAIIELLRPYNFQDIGGPEMPQLPLQDCFIALNSETLLGLAGYKIPDIVTARTTLLVVHEDYRGQGIGLQLAQRRLEYLRTQGVQTLYTNCDDEKVIAWNKYYFGFRETGKHIPKLSSYGRDDRDHWVNLKTTI